VLLRASSNSLLVLCAGALLRAMKPLRVSDDYDYDTYTTHTQIPNYQPITNQSLTARPYLRYAVPIGFRAVSPRLAAGVPRRARSFFDGSAIRRGRPSRTTSRVSDNPYTTRIKYPNTQIPPNHRRNAHRLPIRRIVVIDLDANRVRGDRDEVEGKGSTASGTQSQGPSGNNRGRSDNRSRSKSRGKSTERGAG
jgi:hypothetical protein